MSDKDNPWIYFVVRPVSFYPTWLFLRLGISANQTTLIGLIVGIIGCVFLAFGSYWAAITGAALVNIAVLLDVMDGNVARYSNSATRYGDYLDRMASAIITLLMFITVGVGVFNHPDPYLNSLSQIFLGANIDRSIYLVLGLLIALLSIFGFLVSANLWAVFSHKPIDFYGLEARHGVSLWGIIYKVGLGVNSLIWPLLLVAAVTTSLSIFLLLWTIVATCYSITVTARALFYSRRLE